MRQARGAVSVAAGAWWSATLATPLRDGGAPDEPAVLTIERHGSDGGRAGQRVELFVRFDELESLVTLLDGVLRHARRDGVVPPGGSRASGPDR